MSPAPLTPAKRLSVLAHLRMRFVLSLLLCVWAMPRPSFSGTAASCTTRSIGVDTPLANGWVGVVFGEALGQVFVADDTLVKSISVWRTAIQDTNHAAIKLYITETDSTGRPNANAVILDGPLVSVPFGDGIHPVRFDFMFDPPLVLPRRGAYCFAVQAVPCDATWNILSSNLDPYPGGHLWLFGRSNCFLRTSPRPLPLIDLSFAITFCDVTMSNRKSASRVSGTTNRR